MNRLDSELVLGGLLETGYRPTDDPENADLILFNTCSVRRHAELKVLSRLGALKRLKQSRPDLIIGVMGCMAQARADEIAQAAPHVDLIIGTRQFNAVGDAIDEARTTRNTIVRLSEEGDMTAFLAGPRHRTCSFSAYVSIMRGCDNFCTYCIVPYVRGREFSRPVNDIVDDVRRLVDEGVIEIVLLGQNVNSFGKGLDPPANLAQLLVQLDRIDGLRWIRFITSQPRDMTDELLRTMADLERVTEYLHVPAQSGSDAVLTAMKRGYSRKQYLDTIDRARELMPELSIAGDFIVGFPGETEADFADTVSLMQHVRYSNCFIFKYSPRPGTVAERLPDDVPLDVKKQRNYALLDLQKAISTEDNARLVGSTCDVLIEGPSKRDPNRTTGRTRNNHICITEARPDLVGKIVPVTITDSTALALYGNVAEPVESQVIGKEEN